MKKLITVFCLIAFPYVAGSHVGNPAVTFEGKAGNYTVLVLVTPPDVIPGTATVDIYVSASGIRDIQAMPVYWYAGKKGTPQADPMLPVPGEAGHYSGIIWLMNAGTSGINIEITGDEGTGEVLVPVMAVSTAQKEMSSALGWSLFALCILLVILMVTIISASVSDGLVSKNENTDSARIRRKRMIGAAVSFVLLALILWGGNTWWQSWAQNYQRYMYKPLNANSTIIEENGGSYLYLKVDSTRTKNLSLTRDISFIIPDHGKLMHMFLVRQGTMDVFAHLHPKRQDSVTFVTPLPDLPSGKYFVFADITRLSGFSETIVDTVEIVQNRNIIQLANLTPAALDKDDTFFQTNAIDTKEKTGGDDIIICGNPGTKLTLADGSTIVWEKNSTEPFYAGKVYSLRFAVMDDMGDPAELEPYLGMMGHAVVMKADGSAYIHLHPVGSYSTASQQTMLARFENEDGPVNWDKFTKRRKIFRDSIDHMVNYLNGLSETDRNKILMGEMMHDQPDPDHPDHAVVSFPYIFPSPGSYRIWIQMKRNGRILNSAFDAVVQ